MGSATVTKTKVTAYLCCNGASEAIEFYKRAFGAEEHYRMEEGGRIGHAEIVIGDTTLFLSDEWPEMHVLSPQSLGGYSTSFVLDVPDADAAFERSTGAGAEVERPLKDEPWGRAGGLSTRSGTAGASRNRTRTSIRARCRW